MSGALTWSDLRGRRVALWGVGVEGRASLRRLRADGVEPVVVDRSGHVLEDGTDVVGIDSGGFDLLAGSQVVVRSPGISRYSEQFRRLQAAGPAVVGGLGLWLAGTDRTRVLGVTGSKGKSTTTALAGGLLEALGVAYGLAGNIGICPWEPDTAEADWWVVEISSYQAPDIMLGPEVVAVTSLTEDHLPWHGGSAENYFRDKLSVCTRPGVRQVVANGADPLLRVNADRLGPRVEWVTGDGGAWTAAGTLHGTHNRRNAEIARRALQRLGVAGLDDEDLLRSTFRAFVPLPSRLSPVAELDGVTFVDDSISTTVLSATVAVASFPGRRVGLLVGGLERNIDYRPLAEVAARDDVRVFTMPTNGPQIARVLRDQGVRDVEECASLADATARAFAFARPRGVVLLSPAAASFDLFSGHRERGEAFAAAARRLVAASVAAGGQTTTASTAYRSGT